MNEFPPELGKIHQRIINALATAPDGLSIRELREIVVPGEVQQQFDRRVRELYPFYNIRRYRRGRETIYVLKGPKQRALETDVGAVGTKLRAAILHRDGSRCQMCGRTVAEDHVRLHVDHKIPQSWGGSSDPENLWALCTECNEGKKAFFSSMPVDSMMKLLREKSVHARIALFLKANKGKWVSCDLVEFVANFGDWQTDWRKRLRELRYLGLGIESTRRKVRKRSVSFYRLTHWVELPADPSAAARAIERNRRRRRARETSE